MRSSYPYTTFATYGSPITKLSPALIEGTRPSEPTRAAAASLRCAMKAKEIPMTSNSRNNIAIKIGRDHHIIDPNWSHSPKLGRTSFKVLTVVPETVYRWSMIIRCDNAETNLYTALSTSCSATVTLSYFPFMPGSAGTPRTVSRKRPSVTESTLDL